MQRFGMPGFRTAKRRQTVMLAFSTSGSVAKNRAVAFGLVVRSLAGSRSLGEV